VATPALPLEYLAVVPSGPYRLDGKQVASISTDPGDAKWFGSKPWKEIG
jgi:hypothetical protein